MDTAGREAITVGIAPQATHFERFSADGPTANLAADGIFRVTLRRQDRSYLVEPGRSILETP